MKRERVYHNFLIKGLAEDESSKRNEPSELDYYDGDNLQNLFYPLNGNWFKKRSNIGTFRTRRLRLPKHLWMAKRRRNRRKNMLNNAQKNFLMNSIPKLFNYITYNTQTI